VLSDLPKTPPLLLPHVYIFPSCVTAAETVFFAVILMTLKPSKDVIFYGACYVFSLPIPNYPSAP